MTTPPHVLAWLQQAAANHTPGTIDDPDRLRARIQGAAVSQPTTPADRGPVVSPCDWCRKPGATHGPDEHPLPRDHADYDAFYDATDDELTGMVVEALENFGGPR